MLNEILQGYGLDPGQFNMEVFGSGLIHQTFLLKSGNEKSYILQEVNTDIFKHPKDIAWNLDLLDHYLRDSFPDYFLPVAIKTLQGEPYFQSGGKVFRLTPFVKNSHALTKCESSAQAYEAALQFGKFTATLNGLNADLLRITIPGFHDLSFRWKQFQDSLQNGNAERINSSSKAIDFLINQKRIVDRFEVIKTDQEFSRFIIHHDTKISNVLFDGEEKGICVIDLDTVMPGYFISDLGDMMRTYLSPADEEEKDFEKIFIRKEYVEAIVNGYLKYLAPCLSEKEKQHCFYSGEFMIYMQALRFITDHLNNDSYYGAEYEGQNFLRGTNQIDLLKKYQAMETEFMLIANRRFSAFS